MSVPPTVARLTPAARRSGEVMLAVVTGPGSSLHLAAVPRPRLPSAGWVRVRVALAGICGSDVRRWVPGPGRAGSAGRAGPVGVDLSALSAPTTIPGHEIVGVVTEAPDERVLAEAGLEPGTRVVVDPVLSCTARGLDPCRHCAGGRYSQCLCQTSGIPVLGKGIGFDASLGGGWAEELVAHVGMLRRVPDGVRDRAAVLAEPLSVALSGLGAVTPARHRNVAVVGAGTLGLLVTFAVAATTSPDCLVVVARLSHQASAAAALGASPVVREGDGAFARLRNVLGATAIGSGRQAMLWDGFDLVVEATGTGGALDLALRVAKAGGTVLTLGAIETVHVDLRPLWLKELQLVGAVERRGPSPRSPQKDALRQALDLLAGAPGLADLLVTHVIPLDRFAEGLDVARRRAEHRSLKVVLDPTVGP